MPRYAITDKAGRFVAAHRNTGVGMVLELTEKQAEHELRLGSLVALDTSPVPSDPAPDAPERVASLEDQPQSDDAGIEVARKVRRSKQ